MEAHNGISTRVVEEVGFKDIWASGLTISAQYGVRGNNEASWTQVVDLFEFMSPIFSSYWMGILVMAILTTCAGW
jgi:phosphoenolpyruvate phosphomutase